MSDQPMNLWCRKTRQPVRMRITDTCPHCGQIGHGADLSRLKAEIAKLAAPLSVPEGEQ